MTVLYSLPPGYLDYKQHGELVPLDGGMYAVARSDGGYLSLNRDGTFRKAGEPHIGGWETAKRVGDRLHYEADGARNLIFISEDPA